MATKARTLVGLRAREAVSLGLMRCRHRLSKLLYADVGTRCCCAT